MKPELLLVLKLLDLASLGYTHFQRTEPLRDALRAKVQVWIDTKTGPTPEEAAALTAEIDDKIAWIKEHMSDA